MSRLLLALTPLAAGVGFHYAAAAYERAHALWLGITSLACCWFLGKCGQALAKSERLVSLLEEQRGREAARR